MWTNPDRIGLLVFKAYLYKTQFFPFGVIGALHPWKGGFFLNSIIDLDIIEVLFRYCHIILLFFIENKIIDARSIVESHTQGRKLKDENTNNKIFHPVFFFYDFTFEIF